MANPTMPSATPVSQMPPGAGLLNSGTVPPETDAQDGGSNVTPDEQQEYNGFTGNCLKLIYNQKVMPTVLNMLKSATNPVTGLASTTVMIIDRVLQSAGDSGHKIDGDIALHGGTEVMSDIAELSDKVKIHTYTDDEIGNAGVAAADQYRMILKQRGQLDPGQTQRDLEELKQAEASGALDQGMPDLRDHFSKADGGEEVANARPPQRSGLMSQRRMA